MKKKILVAPLNWGLGHATRCIPIINELLRRNIEVILVADGRAYDLLAKEFPTLSLHRFPGYFITYSAKINLSLKVAMQMPKLAWGIFSEHRKLQKFISEFSIDAVISDSRFGMFSKKIPTAFITHQLAIPVPQFLGWTKKIVSHFNNFFVHQYTECWIPDYEGEKNLSGKLSHSENLPRNKYYIGALSRFQTYEIEKKYSLLVLLSGPEPQRTIFENIIIEQLKNSSLIVLIVQGIPEKNEEKKIAENITIISSLTTEKLNTAILASEIILSRSGYTTVMDLAALGKKAIFVPTPGQMEQEYLAEMLMEEKICYTELQNDFTLTQALEESKQYTGFRKEDFPSSLLEKRIDEFLLKV